jgi:hypothetical protein
MGPEERPESPLASADPPEAPSEPTPAPEQPETPRLGILHLMVLTACVAVSMGIMRVSIRVSALLAEEAGSTLGLRPFLATAGTLYGIGGGGALAGLLLFFARRLRRMRFPIHPGEYLLVLSAVSVSLEELAFLPLYWTPEGFDLSGGTRWWLFTVLGRGAFVVRAVVFIWAVVNVRIRRWRVFFLSIPICYVAGLALAWLMVRIVQPSLMIYMIRTLASAGASVFLLGVVLKDHFARQRYPWSHWLGVALRLWSDACGVITLLWWTILS